MEIFKAHGTGNDFVVLPDPAGDLDVTAATVMALCDRRFGIGADGLLRLAPARPGSDAHVFMDYRNGGDGGIVEMCGNGVRVVAAHLVRHRWTDDLVLRIDTRDGVKVATVDLDDDGRVRSVTVDMGAPRFLADDLPVATDGVALLDLGDRTVEAFPVSMGNPHAVLLCDDPAEAPVTTLGPVIEHLAAFPRGTNVEFVAVRDRAHIDLRVWERGVGETLACGTGVCGAVAALVARGRLDAATDVTVTVPGGTLRVRWDGGADDPVMMTGPAVEVASIEPDDRWLAELGLGHDGRAAALRNAPPALLAELAAADHDVPVRP